MRQVTITMTLLLNDGVSTERWVPQSITEQLDPGEELLAYDEQARNLSGENTSAGQLGF